MIGTFNDPRTGLTSPRIISAPLGHYPFVRDVRLAALSNRRMRDVSAEIEW
jgi:hypothetical protein